ncbi:MAG TPA: hypothetical protein VJK53_03705 [Candidatus Paceibacterota bacterium]
MGIVIAGLIAYSLLSLTTKPRLFFDEGLFIEQAHNFATYGVLDIAVTPGEYSGIPHVANSSGISATLPLAALFKVFGFSIELARTYALLWMAFFLVAAYAFACRYFGSIAGFGSMVLIATFAPFHTNGRMAMGDIPGMTYLLISLLLLRTHVFLAGVFLGLCLVARPSVYAFAVIAVAAHQLYVYGKGALRPLILLAAGTAIPVILELIVYLPGPLTTSWWHSTLLFLKKPTFGVGASQIESIVNNLAAFVHETTLIYLLLTVVTIVVAWLWRGRAMWDRGIVLFASLYGLLGFLYFLRSPGWFKYLLPLQLILFLFLPSALAIIIDRFQRFAPEIVSKISSAKIATVIVVLLVSMQVIQLTYFSDIYHGTDAQNVATYLKERMLENDTIAFIHASQVAMFFPAEKKYSFFVVNEDLAVGKNPLRFSQDELATFIVMPREGLSDFSSEFNEERVQVLEYEYELEATYGRFNVYQLR